LGRGAWGLGADARATSTHWLGCVSSIYILTHDKTPDETVLLPLSFAIVGAIF
jgi:hypothetical protein